MKTIYELEADAGSLNMRPRNASVTVLTSTNNQADSASTWSVKQQRIWKTDCEGRGTGVVSFKFLKFSTTRGTDYVRMADDTDGEDYIFGKYCV